MTTNKQLQITRTFNAPVELVWEMWTKPEHLAQWWGPDGFTTTIYQMNVKEGEEWRLTLHSPDGKDFPNRSIYKEVILHKKIVFEHFNPNFIATIVFDAAGEKTNMRWTMTFENAKILEAVVKAHKADKGLEQNVEKLKNYLLSLKKPEKMKNNLLFDFTVDKAKKTVYVNREFAADLPLVWDAFTKKEILDQWWAPKPWESKTKFMDFKVGGKRFYAMVGPEGQEHWSIQEYTSITPKTNFKYANAFADKDGKPDLPGSDWDLNFSEQDGITTVRITIYNKSLERMEKMIEMGFQGGFSMTLNYLDEMLTRISRS